MVCLDFRMRDNINEVMFRRSGEPIRNEMHISVNFPVFRVFRVGRWRFGQIRTLNLFWRGEFQLSNGVFGFQDESQY